jgi:Fe-S cluster biogenesis protein NfuA
MTMNATKEKVLIAMEQLRPFLHADGGDMEFVELTEDNTVKVRMLGACGECSMSAMTLKAGLHEALKVVAPEIRAVVAVD